VFGTLLNAVCIVLGGILGLALSRSLAHPTQVALKGFLGIATVLVGLRMTWISLEGNLWMVLKQLAIVVLALAVGRLIGRLLHLQAGANRLGQYAKEKIAQARPDDPQRFGNGFTAATVLFCLGPLSVLGAVQDGLGGEWPTLAVKSVMDGLTVWALVRSFGPGVIAAAVPVVSFQGSITLCAHLLEPRLTPLGLVNPICATSGLLVFCVALIVLDIRKFQVADYLPSLAVAPLLAWWWR
jgi:uncharacterized membrane protein YqgA involved in biofilm formation